MRRCREEKPVRVALITENDVFGGINRYCIDLAWAFQQYADLEVEVLVPGDTKDSWLAREADNVGIQLTSLNGSGQSSVGLLRGMISYLREKKPDVIHTQGYRMNVISRIAVGLTRLPTKTVCTVHGAYSFSTAPARSKVNYALDYVSMFRSSAMIAVSEATKRSIAHWYPSERITVVHNGTRVPDLSTLTSGILGGNSCASLRAGRVVGFVGRLSPEKGVDMLINVADRILAAQQDIRLVIVGDGPLRHLVEDLSSKWQDRVYLTGTLRECSAIYRMMDVLILPSVSEGLPMVAVEALSYGVPIVATSVGGVPEVIIEGRTGFTCAYGSDGLMAEKVLEILNDECLKNNMGRAARKLAEKRFSCEIMAENMRQVYRKVLGIVDD